MNKPVLRAWVPALFWLALIAWESTALFSSAATSRALRPLLTFLFGPLSDAQFQLIHGLLRKAGHFFLYAVLSFLSFRAWWATLRAKYAGDALSWRAILSHWSLRAAAVALLMTVTVAALDEWHQSFLTSRSGSVHDVLLDSLGGIFAQLVVLSAGASSRTQRQQHQG